MIEIITPNVAAIRKARYYAETGLASEQVDAMYLGTWLACQSLIELGGRASIDEVNDYAMSVVDRGDPVGIFVGAAAVEAWWGDCGYIVDESDPEWLDRYASLIDLRASMGQLMIRQGEK